MWARLAALCVLILGSAHAGEVAAPAEETGPTGFGCTLETLRMARDCVFEGDVAAAPPNESPAQSRMTISERACTEAARPPGEARADPLVKGACQAEVLKSLERCSEDGAVLVDGDGQFVPAARACYAAVGEAVARAHTRGAVAVPCCRCLAEARCEGADLCSTWTPGTELSGKTAACAARVCRETCGAYLPPDDSEEDPSDDPDYELDREKQPSRRTPREMRI